MGFRVWVLGCGVWGLGIRVWGLGFGVWGLGIRDYRPRGLRTRQEGYHLVQRSGFRTLASAFIVWGLGFMFGVWGWGFGFMVGGSGLEFGVGLGCRI